jgi:hypothetical protein
MNENQSKREPSADRIERKSEATGSLVSGIVLIVIGVLFLIDRFSGIEFGDVIRTWWPLTLVAVGVSRLFTGRDTIWNGLWLVAVGCWLQIVQLHLFGATYRNSWPLLLIALGAGMITRALIDPSLRRRGERNHGC